MSEFSDRVKAQMDQFNSSVEQFLNASRGLYVKIKEESNKQVDELVKAGEAQLQAEESFLEQLKKDIATPFEDVKSTLDQLKNASVGLVVKARKGGENYFDELVELGNSKVEEVTGAAKEAAAEVKKEVTKKVKAVKKTEEAEADE
jgi:transcriptional regulator of heat shock response